MPTCPCGGTQFRASLTVPVSVVLAAHEQTLEVMSLDDGDLDFLNVWCESCGIDSARVGTGTASAALIAVQDEITDLLVNAVVMTDLGG